jgi:hypothetical protein
MDLDSRQQLIDSIRTVCKNTIQIAEAFLQTNTTIA